MFRLANARFHGSWKNRQDVFESFFPKEPIEPYTPEDIEEMKRFPEDSAILFASCGSWGSYDEDAMFLFMRDKELTMVEASHDSRDGLEDNWCPDLVSWLQLWQHHRLGEEHGQEACAAWIAIVGHNVTSLVEIMGEAEGIVTVNRHLSGSGKRFFLVPEEFVNQELEEKG